MSYADLGGQSSMAFDQTRNTAYAAAIRKYVTPDSVVLDLGAGLGVLGLIAAAAGARKVYLVEPESVIHGAREVAERNGFGDRVVAIQGRIEQVDLPEKVDIIISVFTGNLLYSEDLLPSLFHARDRWLKPDGKLIPDAAELIVAPVSAPRLHEEAIGAWSTPHFGLDYGSLRRFAANSLMYERRAGFLPELLAEPTTLVASDLTSATKTDVDAETRFSISKTENCAGVQAWIRIRLGETWLGSGPLDQDVHWTPQLMLFDPEMPVAAGEQLNFHLKRPAHGEWTWAMQGVAGRRRQSTFLSQVLPLQELRKLAPDYVATLSERGLAVRDLLTHMDGSIRSEQIATHLKATYPRQFVDEASALAFVRKFARQYSQ